jgi:glycosyltransferase involved in cell wall biosynthesis
VRREGLEEKIMWIPRFTVRDEVLSVYDKHDLLIFPSMHDSGGTVVLEALSRRLPVICLKLGGPGVLIDSSCGACIDTERRSGEEIIQSIAMELIRFGTIAEPEWNDIRNAAHDRAMQFIPSEIVGKAYSWFTEMKTTPIL